MDKKLKKRALVITTVFMLSCMIRPSWGEENLRQGIYELCSAADEGFVLDAKHCTHEEKDYSSVQLFRPLQVKQQEFYLEFVSEDSCRIISLESGQCLTETDLEGIEAQEIAADAADRDGRFPVFGDRYFKKLSGLHIPGKLHAEGVLFLCVPDHFKNL